LEKKDEDYQQAALKIRVAHHCLMLQLHDILTRVLYDNVKSSPEQPKDINFAVNAENYIKEITDTVTTFYAAYESAIDYDPTPALSLFFNTVRKKDYQWAMIKGGIAGALIGSVLALTVLFIPLLLLTNPVTTIGLTLSDGIPLAMVGFFVGAIGGIISRGGYGVSGAVNTLKDSVLDVTDQSVSQSRAPVQ
jgi:hypothetical protein